jgi:hypothetical protein
MVVYSGFWYSPGHAALGNAACIASTHPHVHQIGLQLRYICFLPLPFLFAVNVDKEHVIINAN